MPCGFNVAMLWRLVKVNTFAIRRSGAQRCNNLPENDFQGVGSGSRVLRPSTYVQILVCYDFSNSRSPVLGLIMLGLYLFSSACRASFFAC